MPKICHMTSAHGVEDDRIFHKECVSLAKAGYDTYLVERGETYDKNGVHIIGVGDIPGNRLKRMTQGTRKVYEAALKIDADIYHFHDPELIRYGLKLKKQGKKVIFDSHEKYTEQIRNKPYLPHWACGVVSTLYGGYEKGALRKIDAIVFPCTMGERFPFPDICRKRVTVDNYPILEEIDAYYDGAVAKQPRSICYAGSLSYDRGITHLLKASVMANCTLRLAGRFSPSDYKNEILQHREYVQYLGQLGRAEVIRMMQSCQIGMATLLDIGQYYKTDNLPTKAYEYMALRLPVILSNAPYNKTMVDKYRFGICVDPENVDEIADAIQYLFDHPDEARKMGENGRRAVEEEFNWAHEEKKLLALYEELLKE